MFDLMTWPRNPWTIFDELESLQDDMNRLMAAPTAARGGRRGRAWRRPNYPLLNVWSSKDGVVIDAELPGVMPDDVDISVMGDQVTLRGKVNTAEAAEGETFYRRERPAGEFVRTLQLPFRADAAGVKATYKNGVLRLSVPRSEAEKPKKIQIEG